jgi:hypothetical protein
MSRLLGVSFCHRPLKSEESFYTTNSSNIGNSFACHLWTRIILDFNSGLATSPVSIHSYDMLSEISYFEMVHLC